jgi:para-nitrobenzyl esterase
MVNFIVGTRRFEKPEALDESDSVKQARTFEAGCVAFAPISIPKEQTNITATPPKTSEDCLFLNVFAPAEKSPFSNGYPVLIFLHGGGFAGGSAEM